jgi:hypothetical protein
LALRNFLELVFLLRLGCGEVELEPAVLPAHLEEILGRYPHFTQQAALCPVQPEVEPRLPAGPEVALGLLRGAVPLASRIIVGALLSWEGLMARLEG